MPHIAHLTLLLFSFVCFLFAAWQAGSPMWNRIVAVGWAAFVLSLVTP